VELDGEVVMEGRARQFPAVDASPVVGDLPLGSGDTHRFTGTLLAEKRHYRSLK
jgi:hypothetical protein